MLCTLRRWPLKRKKALCRGSYVTKLAKNLEVFRKLSNLTMEAKMVLLIMDVMQKMGIIKKQGTKFVLVGQREEALAQPNIDMGEPQAQPEPQLQP